MGTCKHSKTIMKPSHIEVCAMCGAVIPYEEIESLRKRVKKLEDGLREIAEDCDRKGDLRDCEQTGCTGIRSCSAFIAKNLLRDD